MHRLKEGGADFNERAIIHLKFQNFVIFFFENKKQLPLYHIELFVPELPVIFILFL